MMERKSFIIGRQPILNRLEQVFAYELLFRTSCSRSSASVENASRATASVIVHTLSDFGVKEIIGNRQGFINVDIDLLMGDAIEILPSELIGLDLQSSIASTPQVLDRCRRLKESGFVLTLDGHEYSPDNGELYGIVDIIKIDLVKTPIDQLQGVMNNLRRYPVKLLAEKVDTTDAFKMCIRLGFDYFQGYYFARPSVIEKRRIEESGANLLKILRLLLADATLGEIEKVFRSSPGLTYKLLLLVNSVSIGMREKIRDVRHALTILGRQQIKRWVQLALFTADHGREAENPLVEMAAVRAAFMEQLALHHPLLKRKPTAADQAYMVGILSLLERIYQISAEEMVADLNLSDEVRTALIGREGIYGKLLDVAEMMERFEFDAAIAGIEEMGIPQEHVTASQLKAFDWQKQ